VIKISNFSDRSPFFKRKQQQACKSRGLGAVAGMGSASQGAGPASGQAVKWAERG